MNFTFLVWSTVLTIRGGRDITDNHGTKAGGIGIDLNKIFPRFLNRNHDLQIE